MYIERLDTTSEKRLRTEFTAAFSRVGVAFWMQTRAVVWHKRAQHFVSETANGIVGTSRRPGSGPRDADLIWRAPALGYKRLRSV